MDPRWASENLHVIRLLMERSAIYRRALAPVMLFLCVSGILAAVAGLLARPLVGMWFGWYWLAISLIGISGAYLLVRRQALKDHEPFWSPPTRRVTQALAPPMAAGLALSLFTLSSKSLETSELWRLSALWMLLYGCALHAAGFFMQRGIRLFGWGFILAGCGMAGYMACSPVPPLPYAHAVMGFVFGGLHLAYGVYLCYTEARKDEP